MNSEKHKKIENLMDAVEKMQYDKAVMIHRHKENPTDEPIDKEHLANIETSIRNAMNEISELGGYVYALNDYQARAKATDTYPPATRLIALIMGLCSEAGELAGKYKKHLRGDESLSDEDDLREALVAELGDVFWYVAMVAGELDTNLSDVAETNLKKLASRQARGVIGGNGDER